MSYHGTHVEVIEIPEGSWGLGGQTIDTKKISKLIGATQGPKRLAEARENAAKLSLTDALVRHFEGLLRFAFGQKIWHTIFFGSKASPDKMVS